MRTYTSKVLFYSNFSIFLSHPAQLYLPIPENIKQTPIAPKIFAMAANEKPIQEPSTRLGKSISRVEFSRPRKPEESGCGREPHDVNRFLARPQNTSGRRPRAYCQPQAFCLRSLHAPCVFSMKILLHFQICLALEKQQNKNGKGPKDLSHAEI